MAELAGEDRALATDHRLKNGLALRVPCDEPRRWVVVRGRGLVGGGRTVGFGGGAVRSLGARTIQSTNEWARRCVRFTVTSRAQRWQ